MKGLDLLLLLLSTSFTSVQAVTTRWNADFTCDGCVLITTDASLEGTIDTSPTTITTVTPEIGTSVVTPTTTTTQATTPTTTTTTTTTTKSITSILTTQNVVTPTTSTTTTPGNAQTTVTPITTTSSTTSTTPTLVVTTVTLSADSSNADVITTTVVTGTLTTKTYVITTTGALVLIVTETKTIVTTSTVTVNFPYVDYTTSTTIYPLTTLTSTSKIFNGYYNVSSVLYTEYYSTQYKTDYIQLGNTSYYEYYEYFTYTYDEVVTSTFIVFATDVYESYSLTAGYNTIISTIYPTSYVTIITPTSSTTSTTSTVIATTAPITLTTSVTHSTVTVTHTNIATVTFGETTTNVCATQESASSDVVDSIYTGHAHKVHIYTNLANLACFLFAIFQ